MKHTSGKGKKAPVKAPVSKLAGKSTKAAKPSRVSPKAGVELVESFIRDFSLECFLPPHAQPAADRRLEVQVSAGVRPLTDVLSCVNLAIRLRVHTPQGAAFAIAEMIHEGVFKATCENEQSARRLYVEGAAEIYPEAKHKLEYMLKSSGLTPPLPATVDFAEMWEKNHASKASA